MISQALSFYRRHFAALVFTCAVALLPANLLAAGAVVFGLASLGVGGMAEAETHAQQAQRKRQELREKPPADPEAQATRARQLGREALEPPSTVDFRDLLRQVLPIAYATVIIAWLLLAGLFLAHAAASPLILERVAGRAAGAGSAWAVVGARIGPLIATGLLAALLVAVGSLFLVVPGLVLAAGFSMAAPIVVEEGLSGHAALERSWRMMQGHWAKAIAMWALIVVFSVIASAISALVPAGPGRPIASALVRVVLYPLPLTGLVLLYREACQYMRRSSAPG